jgi:DNA-binding transcriptional ArsR family regulator
METMAAVRCFQAIGQTHRLKMFRELAKAGDTGMTAGLIAEVLELTPSQVSFHLKELEASTLCFAEREGRFNRYRIEPGAVRDLLDFLLADCCQGRRDLCSPALPPVQQDCSYGN